MCSIYKANCCILRLVIKASIKVLITLLSLSGIFSIALNWFRSSLSFKVFSASSSVEPLVRKSEETPSWRKCSVGLLVRVFFLTRALTFRRFLTTFVKQAYQ
jgi:hypothetical protein